MLFRSSCEWQPDAASRDGSAPHLTSCVQPSRAHRAPRRRACRGHNWTYISPQAFRGGSWSPEHECIYQFKAAAPLAGSDLTFVAPAACMPKVGTLGWSGDTAPPFNLAGPALANLSGERAAGSCCGTVAAQPERFALQQQAPMPTTPVSHACALAPRAAASGTFIPAQSV